MEFCRTCDRPAVRLRGHAPEDKCKKCKSRHLRRTEEERSIERRTEYIARHTLVDAATQGTFGKRAFSRSYAAWVALNEPVYWRWNETHKASQKAFQCALKQCTESNSPDSPATPAPVKIATGRYTVAVKNYLMTPVYK